MKYSYDEQSNREILDKIKIGTITVPMMHSTTFKCQIKIDQIKFQLQQIFSSYIADDVEPSDLNSNCISTISSVTYSAYSVPVTQIKINCTLTGTTEHQLLSEALEIYKNQIKLPEADMPTDPLLITLYLQQYQNFWDEFRRKLNQTCQILTDYVRVRSEFKIMFQLIITPKLTFLNNLLLAGIQAKILESPEPSFLAIKKCYEIIQACGSQSEESLTIFLISRFQDFIQKSFQCFERSENSLEKNVQSCTREILTISQIICYLNYDQAKESFKFNNGQFFEAMKGIEKNVVSSHITLKIVSSLTNFVAGIVFQKDSMPEDRNIKFDLFKTLSQISQICDFYAEFSGVSEGQNTQTLQRMICESFLADLKLMEQGSIQSNRQFSDVFCELLIDNYEFYHQVALFVNGESLINDLKFTLINYFHNIRLDGMEDMFQQDLVFQAIHAIMICRNFHSILYNKQNSKKSLLQLKVQENLKFFQSISSKLEILIAIVSCCFNGNYNLILARLLKDSLRRIYQFSQLALLEETKLLNLLLCQFIESDVQDQYKQQIDMMFRYVQQDKIILDQETLNIMGYKVVLEAGDCFSTDAPEITHGILNDTTYVIFPQGEACEINQDVDFWYQLDLQVNQPKIEAQNLQLCNSPPVRIEEKICQALIVRSVKVNGPMSISAIATQLSINEEQIKDFVNLLVELDIVSIDDMMRVSYDE
ncbi:hypothetical protein SS50377_20278 [Spironucleus salmonicida]|uniref:Uncharacterized protein n=1 Tax=Spironucleus salmonicida TaxID=348837 RepID=V6LNN5_9EUKA|nr:hypothetical protein SS50377_20278 [Spironucleus salmonicida]|eukprot:EST45331.1 Hypothetical protein SS50377_14909 [Spironucleus salmonicida]